MTGDYFHPISQHKMAEFDFTQSKAVAIGESRAGIVEDAGTIHRVKESFRFLSCASGEKTNLNFFKKNFGGKF